MIDDMILEELRWPEVGAALERTQTVILPVGATEEHGPHLPLCTDTLEAVAVAKEVAKRQKLFLAQALPYGVCRSTRGFPGTITVGHDALRAFVEDLLLSFHDSGFDKVLILTGHAGGQHMSALEQACQRAAELRDLRVSLVSLFALIDPAAVEASGDGHAGEVETSLLLFLREDLVKGKPEGYFPKRPRFLIKKDIRHLMGDGIMGDPSKASAEKGRGFFEMAVQGVIKALEELESFP
jgi:creatinine amidohydrolase